MYYLPQGTNRQTQLDLEREVEDRGMQLRAEAKREHFRIYATCLPQDVPKGFVITFFLVWVQSIAVSMSVYLCVCPLACLKKPQNLPNFLYMLPVAIA